MRQGLFENLLIRLTVFITWFDSYSHLNTTELQSFHDFSFILYFLATQFQNYSVLTMLSYF